MNLEKLNPCIPVQVYPLTRHKGAGMEEGFYWIQHSGKIEVAYFTKEIFEDFSIGEIVNGVWNLTRGDDICNNREVEIITGPLQVPYA